MGNKINEISLALSHFDLFKIIDIPFARRTSSRYAKYDLRSPACTTKEDGAHYLIYLEAFYTTDKYIIYIPVSPEPISIVAFALHPVHISKMGAECGFYFNAISHVGMRFPPRNGNLFECKFSPLNGREQRFGHVDPVRDTLAQLALIKVMRVMGWRFSCVTRFPLFNTPELSSCKLRSVD